MPKVKMDNEVRDTPTASGIAIEQTRFIRTPQAETLFKAAAKVVNDMFLSLTDIQDIMEAELLYMENEHSFCHPELKKSFANTIAAYRNAITLLKILTEEPEMYLKYCLPACTIMKRKNKRGIPHDAFHHALALHNMRFQNEMTSPYLSGEDYEILGLRLANLNTAWKLYVELQRKVLGITSDGKNG